MKKYAILIGNSQFPDESDKSKLPDLACPEKDVDGLRTVLASERGEFDVLSLKNQPSYQILRELQRKVKQTDSEDLLLLYYSGHGKPNKSGLLHLTTLDTVIAELETSAIPINRVYDILGTGKAKKIVIILDCCYSGAAGQGFKGAVDDQLQQLNNARGTYLVTASTELQVAHESAAEGLSLFTKHLIAGLETGEADKDGDGWVSMNELYDYVQGKVVAENPAQQPTKHVKEERGGLFIAKSGRDSRKERAEKIRLLLLELEKQDEGIAEIKADILSIAKMLRSQLSAIQLQKDELLNELLTQKITFISFVRSWDKLMLVHENWQAIGKFKVKDGLAIDTETGLMWLRFTYGQSWQKDTIEGDEKKVNWSDAFEIAKQFNQQGGYAGFRDWRLPSVGELKTLIDNEAGKTHLFKKDTPCINAQVFPNIPSNTFWSSSSFARNNSSSDAWVVVFGASGFQMKESKFYSYAVRLVRNS